MILLLARRPGASAAALGVTGAYAGAGALLAREGLARLREAGPSQPDVAVQDEQVKSAEQDGGSAKRRAKSTAKSTAKAQERAKSARKSTRQSAAKSAAHATGPSKRASKSPKHGSRRRARRTQTDR